MRFYSGCAAELGASGVHPACSLRCYYLNKFLLHYSVVAIYLNDNTILFTISNMRIMVKKSTRSHEICEVIRTAVKVLFQMRLSNPKSEIYNSFLKLRPLNVGFSGRHKRSQRPSSV